MAAGDVPSQDRAAAAGPSPEGPGGGSIPRLSIIGSAEHLVISSLPELFPALRAGSYARIETTAMLVPRII
jgi:hypothetical protein